MVNYLDKDLWWTRNFGLASVRLGQFNFGFVSPVHETENPNNVKNMICRSGQKDS